MIKAYLAGESAETEYRNTCIKKYGKFIECFDPMREIEADFLKDLERMEKRNIQLTDDQIKRIVVSDKAAIESSTVVIAYIRKYSAGTMMEIIHAWNNKIPVYVIDPTRRFKNDVWIKYHSTKAFHSIDDCFNYLLDQAGYEK